MGCTELEKLKVLKTEGWDDGTVYTCTEAGTKRGQDPERFVWVKEVMVLDS